MPKVISEAEAIDAIRVAKDMRRPDADGAPLVQEDRVLLIELAWALTKLLHPNANLDTDYDEQVYADMLSDLRDGGLKTFVHPDCEAVNPLLWPEPISDETFQRAPYDMSFYHPKLNSWDWDGPADTTVFVRQADAVDWLQTKFACSPKAKKRNLSPGGQGKVEFYKWADSFAPGLPNGKQREAWGSANLQGGRDSARDLWKKYQSDRQVKDASKPGPRPQNRTIPAEK